MAFFDYKVDETIKSASIDIWTYENGHFSSPTEIEVDKEIPLWVSLGTDKNID